MQLIVSGSLLTTLQKTNLI